MQPAMLGSWDVTKRMHFLGLLLQAALEHSRELSERASYTQSIFCERDFKLKGKPPLSDIALSSADSDDLGAPVLPDNMLIRHRTVLHPPTYSGIIDVAQKTVKNEGVKGLFKGITPNLLKVVPAVSITYVVYENAKKALHLR